MPISDADSPGNQSTKGRDLFFISYAAADVAWARWIDGVLRQAEYSTWTQDYDSPPGEPFIDSIHRSIESSRAVLCLISEAYFRSRWCALEWQAALAAEKVVPVRIAECKPSGLMAGITFINLVDLEEREARAVLLGGLAPNRRTDRPTEFPGSTAPPPGSTRVGVDRYPGRRGGTGTARELPAIWNIPRVRDPDFTGREGVLEELRLRLGRGLGAERTLVVKGLGGVGKTELALEYAYRYAADYEGIWWLRSEDTTRLGADYAALAGELGLEEASDQNHTLQAVRRALSERERFLLIFDNALKPADLEALLPHGSRRNVLVTTRTQVWPGAQITTLDTLSPENARDFLLKRSRRSDPSAAPSISEEAAAMHIARELGCLPLALVQAAAYMDACQKTLAGYASLLESLGSIPPERPYGETHEQTIRKTWKLNFEALDDCPGAAEVLNLSAFLAPEAIHLSDLRLARERLGSASAAALPQSLERTLNDEQALDRAKAALLRYSLVSAEGEAIVVHGLVQKITRERLAEDACKRWQAAAFASVNALFPEDSDDVDNWPTCARLLAHARTVIASDSAAPLDAAATVRLLNVTGLYLKSRADYAEAEPLYRRALELSRTALRPDDPLLTTSLNNLAELFRAQGRYLEAEPLYEAAIRGEQAAFGSDHPRVAELLNNFALLLKATGRLQQAEQHLRRAVGIAEVAPGSNEPRLATYLGNLARVLHDTGQTSDAEPMCLAALQIHERCLGPNDPRVAVDCNNLARLFEDTGRFDQADPLYRRALEICEVRLSPMHPIAQKIRENHARFCQRRAERENAPGADVIDPDSNPREPA